MPTSRTSGTAAIDLRELIRPDGGVLRLASVASLLVPGAMRSHITAVYAVARMGDDIADEPDQLPGMDERYAGLDFLDRAVDGTIDCTGHPIIMAVRATMLECGLPPAPFHRLFEAFRRDLVPANMQSWDDVMEYCTYSANPVGELVLRIAGDASPAAIAASDAICTALQITNFLQDLSVDLARGRHYVPGSVQEAVTITRRLFDQGAGVTRHVRSWRLKAELKAIILGGRLMLRKCERLGDDLYTRRPTLP
jgi:phytoene/squalene synthetase